MKVLMINGSPHPNGCTARALQEMQSIFEQEGVESEIITVGNKDIRGCISCRRCKTTGQCVFNNDLVNEVAVKFRECDGLVLGSPVYYASANGTLISFVDRLFYSAGADTRMKVGAAVVSARRAGNTATFDELNKYFTIAQMPVASSQYWNQVHGYSAEDVEKDKEGLQTMRTLARNMVFLMRGIALAKEQYGLPEAEEEHFFTSFCDGL
ncbi:MAG: flavodoxin family protein [Oscillospiraceae bacterium]|nr:flavodoxin family protein [Oscillospiraceae bacterium]